MAELEIAWEPTGFLGPLHDLDSFYVIEVTRESAGRWEWWIYFTPTGERIAEGVTRFPAEARRDAARAAVAKVPAHIEGRKLKAKEAARG